MGPTRPLIWMAAASGVCLLAVIVGTGRQNAAAALLGAAGPLAGALGTWLVVERTHVRAPERTSGVMIKLFAAKMLLFGAYVAAAVVLLPEWTTVFVVSFTSQYVVLHFMEAMFFRRLFS
jgi:hypothetical protein